jgi:hypothetical protein
MEPSNDNRPRFNHTAIAGGAISAIFGLVAICTGHVSEKVGQYHHHVDISVAKNPHEFWSAVIATFAISAFCFVYGFTRRK